MNFMVLLSIWMSASRHSPHLLCAVPMRYTCSSNSSEESDFTPATPLVELLVVGGLVDGGEAAA